MVATTTAERKQAIKGGAIAGFSGGLVLTLFMILLNLSTGRDVWMGLKIAAFPLLGERTLLPGPDAGAVLLGLISHFLVAVAWGVLFGLLAFGLDRISTVVLGLLFGVVVWVAMYYVVLPIVGAGALVRGAPIGMAVFQHLLFGVVVAASFVPFQRAVRHIRVRRVS